MTENTQGMSNFHEYWQRICGNEGNLSKMHLYLTSAAMYTYQSSKHLQANLKESYILSLLQEVTLVTHHKFVYKIRNEKI